MVNGYTPDDEENLIHPEMAQDMEKSTVMFFVCGVDPSTGKLLDGTVASAVILGDYTIITANHTFNNALNMFRESNKRFKMSDLKAYFIFQNKIEPYQLNCDKAQKFVAQGIAIESASIVSHPKFKALEAKRGGEYSINDLALVKLNKNSPNYPNGYHKAKVFLETLTPKEIRKSSFVMAAGYGLTDENKPVSFGTLYFDDFHLKDERPNQEVYSISRPGDFAGCSGLEFGDSGGPLSFAKYTPDVDLEEAQVAGILSYLDQDGFGIYVRISAHTNWINSVLKQFNENLQLTPKPKISVSH